MVSFDTTLFGPASTLYAIERAAHDAGYFITIVSLEALDRASVLSAVERLRMQGVDGILVIAPLEGAGEALVALPRDLPLVAVEAGPADALPVVAVDQFAGAALATRHLLELGHPTVAHIAGRARFPRGRPAHRRLAVHVGGRRRRRAAGPARRLEPALGLRAGAAPDGGRRRQRDLRGQRPDGARRAARAARGGLEIPRQVSVVGFDDIPEAQYYTPPLTTVRQDFGEIGRRSLRLMLEMMESEGDDEAPASPALVTPELVLRASTAPA